ncbi:fibronectin type III-like domain-contianing protein [Lactobacillus gasseri]|uniref:fibronectin type III-like domain-contianing protein n=1 Tax=Lactobacillus gasseri TaxID=1596 RepID=UPI00211A4813|nr:fibronectin type III-like domain-contianing protein [Lactobacillus gasseri]
MDKPVKISLDIENLSDYDRKETVQLYIHQETASIVQPVKRLIDFTKIAISGHSSQHVEFYINASQLSFYDNIGRSHKESSKIQVYVGTNGVQLLKGKFDFINKRS